MNKLLNLLKKNQLSSLILVSTTLIGLFSSYTILVYELGRSILSTETAIVLSETFDFKSYFSKKDIDFDKKAINFDKLYLVKSSIKLNNREDLYIVRRITDVPTITIEIGSVVTQKKQTNENEYLKAFVEVLQKALSLDVGSLTLTEVAHAQQKFEWYGYEKNYNFRERYINEFTIRRVYADGAILEYKVDAKGTSIPETFTWIQIPEIELKN